jgi:aminoglycoside phosphotransferase (APT) family kinase protein
MQPKPKPATGKLARAAAAVAAKVAGREIGAGHGKLKRLSGGLSNFVFAIDHAEAGPFVLRLSQEPDKTEAFLKEAWAMERAAEAGIPVAEVVAVGADEGWAWMVQHRVDGQDGTHHPDRHMVLKEMGRLTRTIHTIRTKGFGHAFDAKRKAFVGARTWAEHCAKELKFEERLVVLNASRMLSRSQAARLEAALGEIAAWDAKPVLNHGDMRLKNVIVDGDPAKVRAVIDWELCASSVAPYWDLSLALHDLSIDAKQAYLEGYGLSEKRIAEISDVLKAVNIINYAPAVEQAAARKDEAALERYRTRFSGALDLYSL